MCFAATPFAYWRGDIVFRVDIVCSAFHRGKLAVYVEPNAAQYTIITPSISFNKQYIKVVDIQEVQTFDVIVKWQAYRSWLKTVAAQTQYVLLADASYATFNYGVCNGFIGITPFTKLQSPDNSDVTVLISVMSPNLQVACMSELNMPTARIQPQSESQVYSHNIPDVDINESTATCDNIALDHFGEQVLSFRMALKRYAMQSNVFLASFTSAADTYLTKASFPNFPASILQYGGTTVSYQNLFTYLRYAFLGARGSIRYRIRYNCQYSFRVNDVCKVTLDNQSTSNSTPVITNTNSTVATSMLNGSIMYQQNTNAGIEYEVPFYTNNLFIFPMAESLDDSNSSTDTMELTWFRNHTVAFEANNGTGGTGGQRFIVEVAAGEDFNFLRFQGAPYFSGGIVI